MVSSFFKKAISGGFFFCMHVTVCFFADFVLIGEPFEEKDLKSGGDRNCGSKKLVL